MAVAGLVAGVVSIVVALFAVVDARRSTRRSNEKSDRALDKLDLLVSVSARDDDAAPMRADLAAVEHALLSALALAPQTLGALVDTNSASSVGSPEQRIFCISELERAGTVLVDGPFRRTTVVRLV